MSRDQPRRPRGPALGQGPLMRRHGLPPAEIEARSLAHVECALAAHLPAEPAARAIVVRMVYAAGDLELIHSIKLHPSAGAAGLGALRTRRPVVADVGMVATAVAGGALARLGCPLHVAVSAEGAAERARAAGVTRTAAGLSLLADRWQHGIVVIGTAPTALLTLLDLLAAGALPPALIVGTPVGFVA